MKIKGEFKMCCGSVMYGKCDVCKKEAPLKRVTFYYPNVKCECHSPYHFELKEVCKDCEAKEPMETEVTFKTEELKKLVFIDKDKFEHLLNCMCNQKYIHEQSEAVQREWQEIIDKAYHEARGYLGGGKDAPSNL